MVDSENLEESEIVAGGIQEESNKDQTNIAETVITDHAKQLLELQEHQKQAEHNVDRIIEGVDLLVVQVTTLNERVYTKNYLDKIRNFLILGFIVLFFIVSVCLGYLLINQNNDSKDRSKDAALSRRQIADCTVKPGVVLDDGYINPGKCYIESSLRTSAAIDKLTFDLSEQIRQILSPLTKTTNNGRP